MTGRDNAEANNEDALELDLEHDLDASIDSHRQLCAELTFLFGEEIVEQARHIDISDLNLNKDMLACIADGVRQLKSLKQRPAAQQALINDMQAGARIVLCLWIMDMDLLDKIQTRSYL